MILPFRDRDFQWGGCSHDVSFGTKFRSGNNLTMRKVITLQFRAVSTGKQLGGSIIIFDFSQEFVDAEEKDQIVLHNNEVGLDDDARMKNNVKKKAGRRLLRKLTQRFCRCHGVSGSCAAKVGAASSQVPQEGRGT